MTAIGFIGLGHMGLPMALNLQKAGFTVTGFDLNKTACQHFADQGGVIAQQLEEAVLHQDVVITMLQKGEQVLAVCEGAQGIFAKAKPELLYLDCSTIDVQTAQKLHQLASAKKLVMVDAPVSGGVAGAAKGTLTFMVGGSDAAFAVAKPILGAMGQKIIHTGEAGSGQAAKICNNLILGISMIGISEAFILAEKLNLTPAKLFEVVTNASGRCWAMENYVPVPGVLDNVPANQGYKPGFTSAMMLKDLVLSQSVAENVGVSTPLGAEATSLYQQVIDEGMGELDFSAVIQLIARGL